MKKAIAITVLASVIGLTGLYQASAYMGQGGMKGKGGCPGQGNGYRATAQMDDATKVKFEAFFKDTQELRKNIAVKRAEKRAMMRNEEPDAKKIGAITGELFDLRASMQAKAEAAGLKDVIGQGRGCRGGDASGAFNCGRQGKNKAKGQGKSAQ